MLKVLPRTKPDHETGNELDPDEIAPVMAEKLLLCRDCGHVDAHRDSACFDAIGPKTCPACGSPRILFHAELADLAIAHVDCDAYYASIEKRDRPELHDRPVLVGGGERGVVLTCCYIARRFGVRSAMPMARALQLCPDGVVVKPRMELYGTESRRMRELFADCAPHVEHVSIDEAYLHLNPDGITREEPPARSLARLALQIEKRIGITVSIGLAPNKMLAKLASDLDKPRGFSVIGKGDALDVIGPMPVGALPGVGPVMAGKLQEMGIHQIRDLWRTNEDALIHRFGLWARRLIRFSHAEDPRRIRSVKRRAVSIGAETTFKTDLRRLADIEAELERLCTKLAERLRRANLSAQGLTLKLRRSDRYTITRACKIHQPTQRADILLHAARRVLAVELDGSAFRLIGVTARHLAEGVMADLPDLFGVDPA